jgi:hypothetical protein
MQSVSGSIHPTEYAPDPDPDPQHEPFAITGMVPTLVP